MRWNRGVTTAVTAVLFGCACAQAGAAELSVTNRLQDRREVASGQRSYAEGFEDGYFYANGWHTTGEMGGVWAPPVKLLDGVWFGVNGSWIGQATRFTSGWGYTRYDLPDTAGLQLQRTDFAPDAYRAVLFGLKLTNPGAARTVTVNVDAHSELMGAYPWGSTTPNESTHVPDHGAFQDGSLVFTDDGTVGGGVPVHHYAALVASDRDPILGDRAATGGNFRGPEPGTACAATDGTSAPSACDDGPFGKGTGGQLDYTVSLPAHGSTTVWIAAAGSDQSLSDARSQLAGAIANPDRELQDKIDVTQHAGPEHRGVAPRATGCCRTPSSGASRTSPISPSRPPTCRSAGPTRARSTRPSLGTVAHAKWFGAGFPDYPWIFATDGEYTAFPAVAVGQFATIEDHLTALRDISDILNHRSGIVVHETVSDGSVYFGHDSQTTAADGTVTNDFNTDETVKFPSAVALVWRWTGDKHFLDSMYDFTRRNMHVIDQRFDVDHDGWPEGSGNVERPGMGPEKLDNGVYYMRGLYDLADMARAEHDNATATWATSLADRLRTQFEQTWWDPSAPSTRTRSTTPAIARSTSRTGSTRCRWRRR